MDNIQEAINQLNISLATHQEKFAAVTERTNTLEKELNAIRSDQADLKKLLLASLFTAFIAVVGFLFTVISKFLIN